MLANNKHIKMGLFDGIFGSKTDDRLSSLEERVGTLEELMDEEYKTSEKFRKEILDFLSEPRTTSEIAEKLDKSRSWTSMVLNLLEKKGKVREKEMRGREILYERV